MTQDERMLQTYLNFLSVGLSGSHGFCPGGKNVSHSGIIQVVCNANVVLHSAILSETELHFAKETYIYLYRRKTKLNLLYFYWIALSFLNCSS